MHIVRPDLGIKMRSRIGNVEMAARTPDRSITAPIRPEMVSE
jgi:hypothetical protein